MSTLEKPLHIDIPVKLAEVKVAFSVPALAFEGDLPASINVATGNPYKDLVSDLMKRGVRFELCGATAKVHNWGNEDVLPGIKINTDAMARMTQLVQEGFVKISE